jgi:hypothetical protein
MWDTFCRFSTCWSASAILNQEYVQIRETRRAMNRQETAYQLKLCDAGVLSAGPVSKAKISRDKNAFKFCNNIELNEN